MKTLIIITSFIFVAFASSVRAQEVQPGIIADEIHPVNKTNKLVVAEDFTTVKALES